MQFFIYIFERYIELSGRKNSPQSVEYKTNMGVIGAQLNQILKTHEAFLRGAILQTD